MLPLYHGPEFTFRFDDNRIILIEEEEPDGQQIIKAHDFIGPDIDIGFRIAHYAHRGFVARMCP